MGGPQSPLHNPRTKNNNNATKTIELRSHNTHGVNNAIPANPIVTGNTGPLTLKQYAAYRLTAIAPNACIPMINPAILADCPMPNCKYKLNKKIAPK